MEDRDSLYSIVDPRSMLKFYKPLLV